MMEQAYDTLITGSSGHLGAALMLALPSEGFMPFGIDILPSSTTTRIVDITDKTAVTAILLDNPSITRIVHCATLHKPHIDSHIRADFINVNVIGTITLLEAATSLPTIRAPIQSFVFISTTEVYGYAAATHVGIAAAWIDESVTPRPANIYGITKRAAEDICQLVHNQTGLPIIILRTARFFPGLDDDIARRELMSDPNLKVCELAYRRADISDVVAAVRLAMLKAPDIGFDTFLISAPPPFATTDLEERAELASRLDKDAQGVMREAVPRYEEVFAKRGWTFLPRLDRVYDSTKAVQKLGWRPVWRFEVVLDKLRKGEHWCSDLTARVGIKGYHATPTGVYTTMTRPTST